MAKPRTLFDAIETGTANEVVCLLDAKTITEENAQSFTPPILAAKLAKEDHLKAILTSEYSSNIDWDKEVNEAGMTDAVSEKLLSDEKARVNATRNNTCNALDYAALADNADKLIPLFSTILIQKKYFKNALLLAATKGRVKGVTALLATQNCQINANSEYLLFCSLSSEKHTKLSDTIQLLEATYTLTTQAVTPWKEYECSNPETHLFKIKFSLPKNLEVLSHQKFQANIPELTQLLVKFQNDPTKSKWSNRTRGMIAHLEFAKYYHSNPKDEDALRRACLAWKSITDPNDLFADDKKLLAAQVNSSPVWLGGSYFHTLAALNDAKGQDHKSIPIDDKITAMLTYLAQRQTETGNKTGYSQADFDARLVTANELVKCQVAFHKDKNLRHITSITQRIDVALAQGNIAGRFCRSRHLFADHLREINREAKKLTNANPDNAKAASPK